MATRNYKQRKTDDRVQIRKENPVAVVVKWFYEEHLGVKPDRSIYARFMDKNNPRSLHDLMIKDEDDEFETAVYTPTQIINLVQYLEERGVDVDTLGVVTIPGLVYSFVNRNRLSDAKEKLENTVNYLLGGESNGNTTNFNELPGW